MIKIIGLAGALSSGKDTVASILREYDYLHLSYGAFIRRDCETGYMPPGVHIPNGVRDTLTMLRNPKHRHLVWDKPTQPCIREMLQWWGEWRVSVNATFWTRLLRLEIDRQLHAEPHKQMRVVISDVRRPSEYHQIHDMGGEVWKVDRLVDDQDKAREHITETALAHYQFAAVIDNTQDFVRLRHGVQMCLEHFDLEGFKRYDRGSSRTE